MDIFSPDAKEEGGYNIDDVLSGKDGGDLPEEIRSLFTKKK